MNQIHFDGRTSFNTLTTFVDEPVNDFALGCGDFTYADLYRTERLRELAEFFYQELERADAEAAHEFARYRAAQGAGFSEREESNLLVRVAPHLGCFLAQLFGVEREHDALIAKAKAESVIAEFKKMFIQRRVRKLDAAAVAEAVKDFAQLDAEVAEFKSRWLGESLAIEDEEFATAQLWHLHARTLDLHQMTVINHVRLTI